MALYVSIYKLNLTMFAFFFFKDQMKWRKDDKDERQGGEKK